MPAACRAATMAAKLALQTATQLLFMNARSPETHPVPVLLSVGSVAMEPERAWGVFSAPESPAGAVSVRPPPVMLLKLNPMPASAVHGPAPVAALYQLTTPLSRLTAEKNSPPFV